jgi:hypothetical protein
MKAPWLVAFAVLVLSASPAHGQSPLFTSPGNVVLPPRNVGQYVWVGASEKTAYNQPKTIESDCPRNDVVIGGGYSLIAQGAEPTVTGTSPNAKYNGWMVSLAAGPPATVFVYAGCAPASN